MGRFYFCNVIGFHNESTWIDPCWYLATNWISNLSNFDSQMLVFKDKVLEFNEYSNLRLRDIAWNKFLVRYKHLLKFNKVGGRPSYMRYMFKCDMIIVLRKETFTIQKRKKAKSLKKRMTKRIVKEAKRRHWVF